MDYQMGHYSFTPYPQQRSRDVEPQRRQPRHHRPRHTEGCDGTVCTTCGKCQCRQRGSITYALGHDVTHYCNDYCFVRRPKACRP
jgi:hypothetical protein